MAKHIKIMSNDKVLFEAVIEHCRQCPCYNDGAGGEYAEHCMIGDFSSLHMPSGYDDHGISAQCPLCDVDPEVK